MDSSKLAEKLEGLHQEIHACRRCPIGKDFLRAKRQLEAVKTPVVVIGQALANKTQRLSGFPYRFPDGTLSKTGRELEDFLEMFGFNLATVYSTDAVKCYPGKANCGDRQPSGVEQKNCLPWLIREMALVRPVVVITLGKVAADAYKRIESELSGRPQVFAVPHPAYFRWKPRETAQIYTSVAENVRSHIKRT